MSKLQSEFKALADPTRRAILKLLKEQTRTAGEIANEFRMTKPSISHHLNLLKEAGLVTDERKGQYIVYSLNTTVFQDILSWLMDFGDHQERKSGKMEGIGNDGADRKRS